MVEEECPDSVEIDGGDIGEEEEIISVDIKLFKATLVIVRTGEIKMLKLLRGDKITLLREKTRIIDSGENDVILISVHRKCDVCRGINV